MALISDIFRILRIVPLKVIYYRSSRPCTATATATENVVLSRDRHFSKHHTACFELQTLDMKKLGEDLQRIGGTCTDCASIGYQ